MFLIVNNLMYDIVKYGQLSPSCDLNDSTKETGNE